MLGVRTRFALGLTSATLFAAPALATANDLFGQGQRSQALAGTGAAKTAAAEAGYNNPARFSDARANFLSVGYQAALFQLAAHTASADFPLQETAHGLTLQVTLPVPFGGWLEKRVGLGVGAYLPSQLIARARVPFPDTPQFPLLASRAQALGFAVGLGVDVSHGLRLGAAFTALAEALGTLAVGGGSATTGSEILATFSPILGASYDIDDSLALGLVWRGEVVNEFDIGLEINDVPLLNVPELSIAGVAHYDPMQLQGGVNFRLARVELSADATVKLWSRFTGWRRATVECPPGRATCDALTPEPVEFSSTVVPRLGIAIPLELTERASAEIRLGYFFEPTPLPEQTGISNYWDNDRHVLCAGYGVDLGAGSLPITTNVAWQLHVLADRSHQKLTPGTDAGAELANPGYPVAETGGTVQMLSFNVGARF